MYFLKKLFKTIFVVAIIALVVFCGYRFYKLKREDKLKDVFARNENTINNSLLDVQTSSNNASNSNNSSQKTEGEKETTNEVSNGDKYVVEKQNYDGYYNQFNFDNRLLLYEGKQQSKGVKEAIDLLIKDADDDMYSKETNFTDKDYEGILVYAQWIEALAAIINRGVISLDFIDDMYGYVFFVFVNNKYIQEKEILPNAKYYQGLIKAYESWVKYLKKHGKEVMLEENSLSEALKMYNEKQN